MATSTTRQLEKLLAAPLATEGHTHAAELISSTIPKPIVPSRLSETLSPLLTSEQASVAELSTQLVLSTTAVDQLLTATRQQLTDILKRTKKLQESHEVLEDSLIDHREALVSGLAQREAGKGTLMEQLEALTERRKELETVKNWFSVLAKAEELGIVSLRGLESENLPQAFQGYVALVSYVKAIYDKAPALSLSAHLIAMAQSVWTALVKSLSARLVEKLEAIGWPTPVTEPLEWGEPHIIALEASFVDLLILEKISNDHPLPGIEIPDVKQKGVKPLLALKPLVHPLLLRFRWQFDGDRGTNRIDKPEYPLSHVLNLLTTHERFLSEDIQDILDDNGFGEVDAMTDFTTLLIPPLAARIKHHIPQLLALPPILAHTVYQTLEFDGVLRQRSYKPRGSDGEWVGLSEVILGEKEWFDKWLEGEKEFFDNKYFAAISAPEASHIISEEDFDASGSASGIRPTQAALRVAELCRQLSDRYRPLPTPHAIPFLLSLHLPLLNSYSQRLTSAVDAFESLSFGLLPGALADNRAATAGVGGLLRLVRAGVSARWMAEQCAEWGDDAFFLSLYHYLSSNPVPDELSAVAEPILSNSDGTLFDGSRKTFTKQADRSEELVIRLVVREVLNELKSYLGRRWDQPPPEDGEVDLSLTPDIVSAMSLFTELLRTLVTSFPPALATTLYRRVATALSATLYDRLLVNRTWSEFSAKQLSHDVEYGFLQAGREAGIKRGVGRGWEVLVGGAKILELPAGDNTRGDSSGQSFSDVMKLAFDDSVGPAAVQEAMEELGVGEQVARKEVLQALLRRRPECWR